MATYHGVVRMGMSLTEMRRQAWRNQDVRQLRAQGHSVKEIARWHELSAARVYQILRCEECESELYVLSDLERPDD